MDLPQTKKSPTSAPKHLTPLQILAVAEAYVILADNKVPPEERAVLVCLFGKHLSKHEITEKDIQKLTSNAFDYANKYPFDDFLISIESALTPAQAIAIFANMYEAMVVDGNVIARENEIVEKFHRFFSIDKRVVHTIREILNVKNDTNLFLRRDHPNNIADFRFSFLSQTDLKD